MQVRDILDKAKEEFKYFLNSPYENNAQKKVNGLEFIQKCKKYMEVLGENEKDRFIFLFSIFLHTNSEQDLHLKIYEIDYYNKN